MARVFNYSGSLLINPGGNNGTETVSITTVDTSRSYIVPAMSQLRNQTTATADIEFRLTFGSSTSVTISWFHPEGATISSSTTAYYAFAVVEEDETIATSSAGWPVYP